MKTFVLFCLLFISLMATQTYAATFTVSQAGDAGAGSLRAAVASANTSIDPDTIEFAISSGDSNCAGGICTITLTSGEIEIASASTAGTLTIANSTGASNLVISGNNISRVFYLNAGANLTINGVTITNGNGAGTSYGGYGGGIFNESGILTLTGSTVSGNLMSNYGGGIFNFNGVTTLTNSTVSGNSARFYGGGIYNNPGTTILTNSTVSGNSAGSSGGGIYNDGGILTLTGSTVSSNMATESGGIYTNGTLNLTSVTVTQNKSTDTTCITCAGGIENRGLAANLKNTIVAGNTVVSAPASPDFRGVVAARSTFAAGSSYNLIGNGLGTTRIFNGDANHNQVGIDPQLDPILRNNGGQTLTHALLAGSPAINAGGNTDAPATDQRGFARIIGGTIDIGAYEFAPTKSRKRVRFF